MSVILKSLDFLGFPNYKVGTDGSVWSNIDRFGKTVPWRKLKPYKIKSGRLSIDLYNKGFVKRAVLVHRLVLQAFVGPCPTGMECRHFPDPNPTNNNLENLQWGTHQENMDDRTIHDRTCFEEKSSTWRGDITEERLVEEFNNLKSTVKVARKIGMDRHAVLARLRKYGYRVVRNRAKIGRGWENFITKEAEDGTFVPAEVRTRT